METADFKVKAKEYLSKLFQYFFSGLGIVVLTVFSSSWAVDAGLGEWRWLFNIIFGVGTLIVIVIGTCVFGWFKNYKKALKDAENCDWDKMQNDHSDVVGPFPWKQ